MLLLTLRGTPTMYYGDEIGMHDVTIEPDQVRDPFEKNVPGLGLGRDPVRTPMQWSGGPWADFSSTRPWLPLSADFATQNVAVQSEDPSSLLTLYRRLIELRHAEPALSIGDYGALQADEDLIAYLRTAAGRRFLIVLNFTAASRAFDLAALHGRAALRLSTYLDRSDEALGNELRLRGNEGVIVELS